MYLKICNSSGAINHHSGAQVEAPSPLGSLVRLTKQFKSGEQQHQVQLYQTHCSSKEKLYFNWKMREELVSQIPKAFPRPATNYICSVQLNAWSHFGVYVDNVTMDINTPNV